MGTLGENAKERRAESMVIGRVLRSARAELGLNEAMRSVFREHADRRLIVACFASHLHRIRQVSVAPLFGEAIRSIFEETSISRLFE